MENSLQKKKFSILNVITGSFSIYSRNIRRIILIILILMAPLYILTFFLPAGLIIDLDPFVHYDDFSEMNRVSTKIEMLVRTVSILLGMLISAYIVIAAAYLTKENYKGREAFMQGFFRNFRKYSLKFILVSVIFGILFIPGLYMFFIPSIILWIFFGFSFLAIIIHKTKIIDSFKLSLKLSAYRFLLTLACWVMLLIISLILNPYLYFSIDFTDINLALFIIGLSLLLQFYPLIFLSYYYIELIATIPEEDMPSELATGYSATVMASNSANTK